MGPTMVLPPNIASPALRRRFLSTVQYNPTLLSPTRLQIPSIFEGSMKESLHFCSLYFSKQGYLNLKFLGLFNGFSWRGTSNKCSIYLVIHLSYTPQIGIQGCSPLKIGTQWNYILETMVIWTWSITPKMKRTNNYTLFSPLEGNAHYCVRGQKSGNSAKCKLPKPFHLSSPADIPMSSLKNTNKATGKGGSLQ